MEFCLFLMILVEIISPLIFEKILVHQASFLLIMNTKVKKPSFM